MPKEVYFGEGETCAGGLEGKFTGKAWSWSLEMGGEDSFCGGQGAANARERRLYNFYIIFLKITVQIEYKIFLKNNLEPSKEHLQEVSPISLCL